MIAQKFLQSQVVMARFWGRKDKHKKKAEPNFEFVSPYPLEDCVWQLQNFPGVGEWYPIKTRVELLQLDDETWEFKVHKTYFSMNFLRPQRRSTWERSSEPLPLPLPVYFKIEANGHLKQTLSNSTLVIGQAHISTMTVIGNLFFALTTVILFVRFLLHIPNFQPLDAVLLITVTSISIIGIILIITRRSYIRTLRSHIKRVLGP